MTGWGAGRQGRQAHLIQMITLQMKTLETQWIKDLLRVPSCVVVDWILQRISLFFLIATLPVFSGNATVPNPPSVTLPGLVPDM